MTLKNLSLAIFIFAIFGCKSYNEEQLAVKKCYDDFTAALIKKDGKAAASLLSDIDINYYDSILYHAKYSSRQEIAPLLTADKAAIIYARLYFTKEELKQMTAESFFAKSVELGKIANDLFHHLSL